MTPEQLRRAIKARGHNGTRLRAEARTPARSKYNNVQIGGYDSMKERRRAQALRLMERGGLIQDLHEQVKFLLIDEQRDPETGELWERECHYVADFTYRENGRFIVEDVKGVRTDVYKIKKKLMLARYGIRIKET